jgi:hypothetical protein
MAGEAVSRTSLTLAFQKKQDLEWRKLREHLHLQLQQDIGRSASCNDCNFFRMQDALFVLEGGGEVEIKMLIMLK